MLELNICLIPPRNIIKRSIKISQKLTKQYPTEFSLGNFDFIPHLSLYHFPLPEKNLETCQKTLKIIADNTLQLSLSTGKFYNKDNYLCWQIESTDQINSLHAKVLKKINPLREGLQRIKLRKNKDINLNLKQIEYTKKYAYPLVLDDFKPHITLTKFKNFNNLTNAANLEAIKILFEVKTLVLGKIGPYGTLSTIIKEFKLK